MAAFLYRNNGLEMGGVEVPFIICSTKCHQYLMSNPGKPSAAGNRFELSFIKSSGMPHHGLTDNLARLATRPLELIAVTTYSPA